MELQQLADQDELPSPEEMVPDRNTTLHNLNQSLEKMQAELRILEEQSQRIKALEMKNSRLTSQTSLFPDLPDKIAVQCMARLPRRSRAIACCVCRRWRDVLQPRRINLIRRSLNIAPEIWVFMMVRNGFYGPHYDVPASENRFQVRLLDTVHQRADLIAAPKCLFRGDMTRLMCIGGNRQMFVMTEFTFFRYSFDQRRWRTLPHMSNRKRENFAYALLGKYIYVAGGRLRNPESLSTPESYNSAERFDTETDRWEKVAPMNRVRIGALGFVMDDKFYVIGGNGDEGGKTLVYSGEYFDPGTGVWTLIQNNWAWVLARTVQSCKPSSLAVINDKLYVVMFDSSEILAYDIRGNWKTLENFPPFTKTTLLNVGEKIWIIKVLFNKEIEICCLCDSTGASTRIKVEVPGIHGFSNLIVNCTAVNVG